MTFTKAVPDFLRQMQQAGTVATESGGASKGRRPERDDFGEEGDGEEHSDSDRDGEEPIVVDEREALTSEELRRLEKKERKAAARGGSLHFKGDGNSAEERFRETSAQAEAAAAAAAAAAADDDAGAGGPITFKAKAGGVASMGKRKKPRLSAGGALPAAKAVRNSKLLSFAADEEDGD